MTTPDKSPYSYPFVVEMQLTTGRYVAARFTSDILEATAVAKACKKSLPGKSWYIYDTKNKLRTAV